MKEALERHLHRNFKSIDIKNTAVKKMKAEFNKIHDTQKVKNQIKFLKYLLNATED